MALLGDLGVVELTLNVRAFWLTGARVATSLVGFSLPLSGVFAAIAGSALLGAAVCRGWCSGGRVGFGFFVAIWCEAEEGRVRPWGASARQFFGFVVDDVGVSALVGGLLVLVASAFGLRGVLLGLFIGHV